MIGAVLEVIVALAGIGTAVVLYPVVKRQNQGAARGFVAVRVLEAAIIVAGVVALLSIVTLMPALNALLLGSLLYQWERVSTLTALAALPIAVWEFSLGIWLVVKGFKPAPIGQAFGQPV